jgi:hypothetical protein
MGIAYVTNGIAIALQTGFPRSLPGLGLVFRSVVADLASPGRISQDSCPLILGLGDARSGICHLR